MSLSPRTWFVLTVSCLTVVASVAIAKEQDETWNTPSAKVDSAVAAWATERLASAPEPESEAKPEPVVEAPTHEPNPFQADPQSRVEPVRFDQPPSGQERRIQYDPDAQGVVTANPLRSGSRRRPASAALTDAERAFSALPRSPAESTAARAAFAAQESQPQLEAIVPTSGVQTAPIRLAQQPRSLPAEPQPFAPVTPIAPRVSMAAPVERSVIVRQEPIAWDKAASPSRSDLYDVPPTVPIEGSARPGDASLEGPQQPSLSIEKRGPDEARVGQTCRFVVKVRNTGRQTAQNVVLRDATPEGSRLIETLPSAEQSGDQLLWKLGALAPGEERSVEMRIEPRRQGPLGSVATVSFDAQASAKTRCTSPELALRITAPGRVRVGQQQPVHVELHNPGTGVATGIVLVEDVPANLRHAAGPSLEFEVGSLAPGEHRKIDLMLTAEEAGHVVNAIVVSADGGLRVEQSVEFDVVAPSLELSVDGPKRRYLERPASYTLNIENPGSAPAKNVRLVSHLPRGLKFVRANNLGEYDEQTHSVYWSLAELPEGERGSVELTALPVSAGEHTLRTEGQTGDGLKVSKSSQLVVEGVASLAFDVRDRQDPIEVGSDAIYDVVVTNEGTQAASAVRVTLEAPAGMRVVDAQGKVAHRLAGNRVEFAPLPTLQPGERYPYRVRLRGEQPGDQRVTVLVESDGLDQPIRREESTRVFGDE